MIVAVSLHLPLIWEIAKYEHPEAIEENFYKLLDDRLQMIREFLNKRYDSLANMPCSSNPLCYTQGGLYKGHKKPDEKIGDLVNYMTASFGITALHELTECARGCSLREDKASFAKEVVKHIKDKVDQFKKEDGRLYALYGTPAESLCQTQANQLRAYLDSIGEHTRAKAVPEYLTNSFHLHVSEDISPFEKQDGEFELFHMIEGGHIQYTRIDDPSNIKGMRAIVERGMELGFYQGVNFDAMVCNDCGHHTAAKNGAIFSCPDCGSHNVTTISRVCG